MEEVIQDIIFFCGMMMIGTKDAQGSGGGAGERERDIEEGSGDPA